MGEKGLMEEDWNDRSNWRKKVRMEEGRLPKRSYEMASTGKKKTRKT
jgi:hypothetical protein